LFVFLLTRTNVRAMMISAEQMFV